MQARLRSNDCKVPNEKARPSVLAMEVWLVRPHMGWDINRIPYYWSDSYAWLGVGRLTGGLKNQRLILDNQQLYVHACK